MVRLYESETDRACGILTDRQFQALAEALEEDDLDEGETALTAEAVDLLEEQGGDQDLVDLLRALLGDRDEVAIRWERS
ncbi:MAG TPA: hypothetical protein VNN07_04770 [Candidatus Tectomicrobia bacterium]|nr:hypothetical protein [Candidatus Tectomicrobia bacterium]